MRSPGLARSTPSAEGVDARGVAAFLDDVAARQIELHSLMLLRHGRVVAEGWWHPYGPDRVHLLYSLSKSFTSTAAGFAVAEGLLDLNATVLSYFPELDASATDPGSRSIRVRHIAAMASGHRRDTVLEVLRDDPDDLVRGFLRIPPDAEPGTVFAYNQPCTYTLGRIVQRVTGQSLLDYLRPRLFEPFGVRPGGWLQRAPGDDIGWSGLHLTTEALACLGQLYLQQGRWQDRVLLDPEWVREATTAQVANPDEPNPDWRQGYGFQFWRSRHGYRGDGAYGQFCVVLPEHDTVIVTTAATYDMQGILEAAWARLLPAVGAEAAVSAEADRELAVRLSGLALPTVVGDLEPTDAARWDGVSFEAGEVTTAAAADDPWVAPRIDRVSVHRAGPGWQLRLSDTGGSLTGPLGRGEWVEATAHGVPIAISGGWTDPDTLTADVIFTETPHRVRLTCSRRDATFTTHWPTVPLHPRSITELRSPPSGS